MLGKGVIRALLDKLLIFHDWHKIGRGRVYYTKFSKSQKLKKRSKFLKSQNFQKYKIKKKNLKLQLSNKY